MADRIAPQPMRLSTVILMTAAESFAAGNAVSLRVNLPLHRAKNHPSNAVTHSPFTNSRGWFRWLYTMVSGLMPTAW